MKSLYLVGLCIIVVAAIFGLQTTMPRVDHDSPKPSAIARIVSLAPSMSDTVIALGLADRLVGITIHCSKEEAKHAITIGSFAEPNFEAIMELKPDLVLGVPHVMAKPVLDLLVKHGVDVYAYQPDSLSDIKTVIVDLATKLSVPDAGDALLKRMDQAPSLARANIKGTQSQPKTFLIAISDSPLVVAGKNTFASEMVESLGLTNLADDPKTSWPVWSLESLLAHPPQLLILANGSEQLAPIKKLLSSLGINPVANSIQVIAPNRPIFQTPSPRLIDDLAYLTRYLLKAP